MGTIKLGIAALGTLSLLGIGAGTALADTSVSIVHDSGSTTCDPAFAGSPCFGPPNTGIKPGDKTVLTATFEQDTTQEANATVHLSWDGALTFTGNGDTSAVCTAGTKSETCVYTDFAHQFKSDGYNFTVGNQPLGTVITTTIKVTTGTSVITTAAVSGGTDSTTATLTMASAPTASPSPTASASATATATAGGVLGITTPDTGSGGVPVIPIGAALLVIGGVAVVAVRRGRGEVA